MGENKQLINLKQIFLEIINKSLLGENSRKGIDVKHIGNEDSLPRHQNYNFIKRNYFLIPGQCLKKKHFSIFNHVYTWLVNINKKLVTKKVSTSVNAHAKDMCYTKKCLLSRRRYGKKVVVDMKRFMTP